MNHGRMAWLVVALLWVAAFLNYVDRQVIFSLFPLLRAEWHVSDAQLGLLSTSFLWIYGLSSLLGGYLADRFGPRRLICVSLLCWSAITGLTGMAASYPQLLIARGLMGISEAFYLPAALTLIAGYHTGATRSRATGLHYSGIYAGAIAGGIGGGWLGQHYGWRLPFLILGGAGVVYTLVVFLGLPDLKIAPKRSGLLTVPLFSSLKPYWLTRSFLTILAAFAVKSMTDWLIYTWVPTYLYDRFHMSLSEAAFSATLYLQVSSVLGILLGGWLADVWSRKNSGGRFAALACGLAISAPVLIGTGTSGTVFLLLAGLASYGLGRGMFDANAMPALCGIVPETSRAISFGLMNVVGTFTGGVVALAGGFGKQTLGVGTMLSLGGSLLLVVAFLLWRCTTVALLAPPPMLVVDR